ncbi:uncharacterized protein LOC128557557 [Mercenaria mercenaria]|uniref:uncharacterized protein LOC128557557 n=3 Tax=Mercenaria mercenaria TaxID=6596 RepID=UPI00234E8846|nr:uncharacterized protein LOC128557557 [Mercenaria mercenaria]
MPYHYRTYDTESLQMAAAAVQRKLMSARKAAVEFRVPRSTLQDHVRFSVTQKEGPVCRQPGRKRDLSADEETSLAEYLRYMASQGLPATREVLRQKVVDIILLSGGKSRINTERGPTDRWIRQFLERHGLSDRLAENISKARASMSTPAVVDEFFEFFREVMTQYDLLDKPERIFNCDETGWTGKEKSAKKVIGPKGGHLCRGQNTPGSHITAHVCVCASGRFLPTLVVYQGSLPHKSIEGVPDTWQFAATETGYLNADLFHQWFTKLFIPHCGKERPVVLIMDNHNSHVSVNTVKDAIDNDIVLVGLPGNTTHILQPLDVKVFGPLKSRVDTICSNMPFARRGTRLSKIHFPAVLRHAMEQATPASIRKSFEVTGLCPLSRAAIDTSQLLRPAFGPVAVGGESTISTTCPTCGHFVTNPLVTMGIVTEPLARVLLPPPTAPLTEKKQSSKRVEKGRVLSTQEILSSLQEKEKKEEERRAAIATRKLEAEKRREAKAKDAEERRLKRAEEQTKRAEKRKREEEEKAERKRLREERKAQKEARSLRREIVVIDELRASMYICNVCGGRGRKDDEVNGVEWYGCDGCEAWYHDGCLSVRELEFVRVSLNERSDWLCKSCSACLYEE